MVAAGVIIGASISSRLLIAILCALLVLANISRAFPSPHSKKWTTFAGYPNDHTSRSRRTRPRTPRRNKGLLSNNSENSDSDDGWDDTFKDDIRDEKTPEIRVDDSSTKQQERDLFIPIFAIVSLAGLFGAYAYEMIRLYLNGELYLPQF